MKMRGDWVSKSRGEPSHIRQAKRQAASGSPVLGEQYRLSSSAGLLVSAMRTVYVMVRCGARARTRIHQAERCCRDFVR